MPRGLHPPHFGALEFSSMFQGPRTSRLRSDSCHPAGDVPKRSDTQVGEGLCGGLHHLGGVAQSELTTGGQTRPPGCACPAVTFVASEMGQVSKPKLPGQRTRPPGGDLASTSPRAICARLWPGGGADWRVGDACRSWGSDCCRQSPGGETGPSRPSLGGQEDRRKSALPGSLVRRRARGVVLP